MDTGSGVFLSLLVRLNATTLHYTSLVNVDALFNNIELHKTAVALVSIADGVQLLLVKTVPKCTTAVVEHMVKGTVSSHSLQSTQAAKSNVHITNVANPVLQGSHVVVVVLSSLNTSTFVVAAHNNVWDLQVGNGVLQCRH